MIDKGLTGEVADMIGTYVQLKGSAELIDKLHKDTRLMSVHDAEVGVNEMQVLFQYCVAMNITDKVHIMNKHINHLKCSYPLT